MTSRLVNDEHHTTYQAGEPEAQSEPTADEHEHSASLPHDAETVHKDDAPFDDYGAETMRIDLAAFSLTREQVAERYRAAGFDIQPRTVSDYAKRGTLRAHKVPGKNGLSRYLFDTTSVDEDIERRRQEAKAHAHTTMHALIPDRSSAQSGDYADTAQGGPASSVDQRLYERDLKIARLETELQVERRERQKAEQRAERDADRALQIATRAGQLQQQIVTYQERVKALEAPKPEPAPELQKRAPFLHRLFRRGERRA